MILGLQGDFYEAGCCTLNLAQNQRLGRVAGAVAVCQTAEDVEEAVKWASERGYRISSRSGGHCYEGTSLSQRLVLDISCLNQVELIEPFRVRVGAGLSIGELYRSLLAWGRQAVLGTCPGVGIAGYTLGGGISLMSRKFGLALDQLTAVELVDAQGERLRVSEQLEGDLFWALRGGPTGQFGVVTALELQCRPLPKGPLTVYNWRWPLELASQVVQAWFRWIANASDDLASMLILQGGQGDHSLCVQGQWLGEPSELRPGDWPRPEWELLRSMGYAEAVQYFSFAGFSRWRARSDFIDQIPEPGLVQAWVERLQAAAPCPVTLQFDAWGGAISRVATGQTAFCHRQDRALMQTLLAWDQPQLDESARGWLRDFVSLLPSKLSGRAYQNYRDHLRLGAARAYFGEHLDRLRELKRVYDPEGRWGDPADWDG